MKSLASKLIPVAIASILCGVAVAGGGDKGDKMSALDKDGDGKISAAEYAEHSKTMFDKMDTNHDGQLTAAELDAHHASMAQAHGSMKGNSNDQAMAQEGNANEQRMGNKKAYDPSGAGKSMPKHMTSAETIAAMDTNNDGKLSASEWTAGSKKMFSKMDKDHDGSLTAQELRSGDRSVMTASDVE